jgi:hypothetical protein
MPPGVVLQMFFFWGKHHQKPCSGELG